MNYHNHKIFSLRAFGHSGYCDPKRRCRRRRRRCRRRCRCRCRRRHTFVPRQNLRTAIGMDLMNDESCTVKKKMGLRMGKALGKIDFLRFFNKKIDNFRTKIDMDLNFFLKIA